MKTIEAKIQKGKKAIENLENFEKVMKLIKKYTLAQGIEPPKYHPYIPLYN
ncbi:MAG: hypothetical protein AABW50_01600 [Nanoarchaeota archaeon]